MRGKFQLVLNERRYSRKFSLNYWSGEGAGE